MAGALPIDRLPIVSTCPECGAPLGGDETCADLFNRMLAVEWEMLGAAGSSVPSPALLSTAAGMAWEKAHLFAVGAYQLQHPARLTEGALLGLHAGISDVLGGRRRVADVRLDARRAHNGPQRVLRRPEEGRDAALGAWPTAWPVTVADCCNVTPGDYAASVHRFAEATVAAIDAVRSAAPAPSQPPQPAPRPRRADRRTR